MSDSLISLQGVTRGYDGGRVEALGGVDLELTRGEWLTIVGPSGSGKSTLLQLMSGLDKPDQGRVVFEGRYLSREADWAKIRSRQIGFVFQSFNLLPALTALENIQVPMFGVTASAGQRRQKAEDLLERVGLAQRASHRPADLSGGERQRVAVARCLANDPILILADEPTGNLDSTTSAAIMDLLHSLSVEQGTTTVMVTHDAQLARRGDRRIEMLDGLIRRQVDLKTGQSCIS